MAKSPLPVVWARNTGQNGWDAIIDVPLNQSVSSRNVHLFDGGLGTRRGGSVSVTITGVTAPINALIEYIPGQDETAAELFVVDSSGTTKILRCAGGTSFTNLTLKDNVATTPTSIGAVVHNGKLYLAYDSTVNRLHVFDPGLSTTDVRRAGMGTPAAPSLTQGGAVGTFIGALRYYRIAWIEKRSGVTVRRSLLGPSAGLAGNNTRSGIAVSGATISEGETHWELYASADDVLYYLYNTYDQSTSPIASGIVDSTVDPASYAAGQPAPIEGANTPFPSVKSIGSDGSRLYGLGVWETTAGDSLGPKAGRFFFGPVLDSLASPYAVHDDERINNTTSLVGYIDLSRNGSAVDRGVAPHPVNNVIYAFLSSGVYGLYPTDAPITPYRRVVIDAQIGNLAQQAIVMAHDRNGAPCCFFWDPIKGPYVVGGADGLRWCGKDVANIAARVNKDATTLAAWGLWKADQNQVVFAVAIDGSNTPNFAIVADVTNMQLDDDGDLRGGWVEWTGDLVSARCGVMFSTTLAATRARTRTLYTGGNSKLLRYDESVNQDDTTNFQAYVQSGSVFLDNVSGELQRAYLIADASSGVTVRQSLIRNSGDETRTSNLLLTAAGTETIVLKKAEDATVQDAWTLQVQLGDAAAQNVAWHFYQWRAQLIGGGPF